MILHNILQSSDNKFMACVFYYYLFCYIVITSNDIASTAHDRLAIFCCFGDSEVALRVQLRPGRRRFTLVTRLRPYPLLTSIWKDRGVTLETKVKLVNVWVFPIVLYGAETWTMRKHERRKIDAFELWCWRRVLRISWMERQTYGSSRTSNRNGHWSQW